MPATVVITGASAGLGRATAHAFAARGDRVLLLARSEESLQAAVAECLSAGAEQAIYEVCDVTDAAGVEAAAARAEAELGPIDVWVNDAMITSVSRFLDMEDGELERITDVVYHGTVHGTRAALKRMVPRGSGTVVQVGSSLAYRAIPLQSAYCAAKHAIQGFTESVRSELLHDGSDVHLTMVQMPALNTPQFSMARNRMDKHPMPVPPIYEPEVGADAIVWSTEHRRREIWVGASTPVVIVGNGLLPSAGDHFLAATGFDGQQSEMEPDPGPDYLFEPRPGDHGTRGRFSDQARTSSTQFAITKRMPDWAAGKLSAGFGALAGRLQK